MHGGKKDNTYFVKWSTLLIKKGSHKRYWIDLSSILMRVFDLKFLDAKCSYRKSKSLLYLLNHLDENDQLFEL